MEGFFREIRLFRRKNYEITLFLGKMQHPYYVLIYYLLHVL